MSRSYKKHGYDAICSSYGDKHCRKIYHHSDRQKAKRILKEVADQWYDIPYSIEGEIDILGSDCLYCEITHFGLDDIPYDKYMDEIYDPDFEVYLSDFDWINDWEEIADKLLIRGIDYSVRYADKWSWASDGGNYFCEDRSTAHRHLDMEIFGNPAYKVPWEAHTFWERYVADRDAKYNHDRPNWCVQVKYRKFTGYNHWFNFTEWDTLCPNYETKTLTFQLPYTKKVTPNLLDLVYEKVPKEDIISYDIHRSHPKYKRVHSDWRVSDFILYRNLLPQDFQTADELYAWIHKHEEQIITSWLKVKFHK